MRLEISSLRAGYGTAEVVRGVDLTLPEGECLALMGRNGMGKSTLLRAVLGFVTPMAGSVRLDGEEVTGGVPHEVVRRGIGYAPQEAAVFADLSVDENLRIAMGRRTRRQDQQALEELLGDFPVLARRGRQKAGSLSGGEQKMLILCRALLRRPSLLLVDEVTEGLQPSVVGRVAEVIARERRVRGTTVLLVEQNLDFAVTAADRVVVLRSGELVADVSRSEPRQTEIVTRAMGL
jgi:branched-chain amino acid transport system ATP-binding protein